MYTLTMLLQSLNLYQVENGVILPDKASLYITAIEDAEYKDEKIHCMQVENV